jgi:hypothetical protein
MLALAIIDGSIQEGQSITIKVKNNTITIQQK